MHDDSAAAKRLDLVTSAMKKGRAFFHDIVFRGRQPQRQRKNQSLGYRTAAVESVHQFFEQDPLVRRMLIDDEQAAAGLGQNVRIVNLPQAWNYRALFDDTHRRLIGSNAGLRIFRTRLGAHEECELLALLREMVNQDSLTVLMVTHDQELANSFADRIVFMKDGRIV